MDVPGQIISEHAEFDPRQREHLSDVVVKVHGDAPSLPFLGEQQFRGQEPQLLLIGAKLLLGLFPLGDVPLDRHEMGDLSPFIPQGGDLPLHIELRSVFPGGHRLEIDRLCSDLCLPPAFSTACCR